MGRTASAPARLDGTVFVSPTRLLYVGSLVATTRHAHHATQIVIAPGGLDVEDDANGRAHLRAAVIPPRLRHGHGAADHACLVFVDGDERASRELSRDADPRCRTWARDSLEVSVPRDPTLAQARALLRSVIVALDLHERPIPRHPATRRMCTLLDAGHAVDIAKLSREAGLSPRQMREAFARDVGLPMRAYVRWRRAHRAIAAVMAGASLSAAAVLAGFADSAHLSRVFREHFGMAPSQGLGSVTWRTLDDL